MGKIRGPLALLEAGAGNELRSGTENVPGIAGFGLAAASRGMNRNRTPL